MSIEIKNTNNLLFFSSMLLIILLLVILLMVKKRDEKFKRSLEFIAQVKWIENDSDFLQALVRFLAKECSVKYALIDEIHGEEEVVATTVALFADGKIEENIEYKLKYTPCGKVFGKRLCTYKDNVQALFPKDELLKKMGVESYIGLPLFRTDGTPIGLIAVMDDKKIKHVNEIEILLQFVALRAGFELEKYIYEEEIEKMKFINKSIVDSTEEGIVVYDKDLNYLVWNNPIAKITEVNNEQLLGRNVLEIFPDLKNNGMYHDLERVVKEGVKVESEYEFINPSNESFWFRDYTKPMINDQGDVVGVIKKVVDITSYKEKEKELIRLNKLRINTLREEHKFDILTGTYTKKYGIQELEKRMEKSTKVKSIITISFIDLNNLKLVNDTYGHPEGDKMIKLVCDIINRNIRSDDFLTRFGGDEFLLVFTNTSEKDADIILNRVNEELENIEMNYRISFAFGVTSINSSEDKGLDDYIKDADYKMYKKKERMKHQHTKGFDDLQNI